MKKNIIRMAAVLTMAVTMSAFTNASSDKEATPERQQLASTMNPANSLPASSYATVYPLTVFMRIFTAQMMVMVAAA